MDAPANTFKQNSRNLISRNRPVAVIANACTFLGASLTAYLLDKDIQVIALDDLTVFDKRKLGSAVKNKDFHSMNLALDNDEVVQQFADLQLPRLDYGFFITDSTVPDIIVGKGIINFLHLVKDVRDNSDNTTHTDRPRLALVSSINLYGKNLNNHERILKEAEVKFAKGIKHFKLNGRVVRLAEVFGPSMELDDSPLSVLIGASVTDNLSDITTSLDFTQRSLFIDDAVSLLVKSVLSGSTSNKIYDGALLHPVKLSDVKQILQDPMWYEEEKAKLEKLPAWPTPNLVKTIKELNWSSKTPLIKALRETMAYFKEHQNEVPQNEVKSPNFKADASWSFAGTGFLGAGQKEPLKNEEAASASHQKKSKAEFENELIGHDRNSFFGKTKRGLGFIIIASLFIYGLIWPAVYLGYQALNIRQSLLASREGLESGDFEKSQTSIKSAQNGVAAYKETIDNFKILERIPGINNYYVKASQITDLAKEGIDGVYFATTGSKALFETTKIISGESREDPRQYYQAAQIDLDFAAEKLSRVSAGLGDPSLKQGLPQSLGVQLDSLKDKLGYYLSLVEQTQSASELMPKITGLEGKKSYLVLLQNNLELRPTGGFIGSYAKLDFDNGRLTDIKVDDIYSLDGNLKEVIAPPAELRSDLNLERLYLRDSNYDPDFPTAARQASFFYKKEAGETVHGVIALDLKASGNLLDAVGGLDLPEYGESVNGANLFERAITHAEAGFFPGSQAKKNYLTSLQNQMFNKIFYLSKQNWPAIIRAISKSLNEKHMLVYLEDPALFSYLASSNWSGVFPREGEVREGETNDFLAVVESNMGANKSNYFLQRKYDLASSFTKEGKIQHQLKITYKNSSPSEIFPAGIYKNRIRIYTPIGTKLNRAMLGKTDITSTFAAFSDYGRSGFSSLIQIAPKEQKQLVLEYELATALNFKDNQVLYKLEILKQPGTIADPLDFVLTHPINFKLEEAPASGNAGVQEVKIITDLLTDRVFQFRIKK